VKSVIRVPLYGKPTIRMAVNDSLSIHIDRSIQFKIGHELISVESVEGKHLHEPITPQRPAVVHIYIERP
jgi:hypothetical protein